MKIWLPPFQKFSNGFHSSNEKTGSVTKIFPAIIVDRTLAASPLAFVHTGDGPHNVWLQGFAHPLSGLDHMLAMVALGIGLALLCKKFAGARWIRFSGIIIASYGGFLLIP